MRVKVRVRVTVKVKRKVRVKVKAQLVPRLPRKSSGAKGTPEGCQGVHPTPWQWRLPHACHAKAAEPKERQRRTSDPLAGEIVPRLPRKSSGAQGTSALGSGDCPTPATQKRRSPRNARGTPGRTTDPLAAEITPRLPRKSDGAQGTTTLQLQLQRQLQVRYARDSWEGR